MPARDPYVPGAATYWRANSLTRQFCQFNASGIEFVNDAVQRLGIARPRTLDVKASWHTSCDREARRTWPLRRLCQSRSLEYENEAAA
jgi:hypothetical protein